MRFGGIPLSRDWGEKADRVSRRLSEFSRLFKSKSYCKPSDLFFSIEDLPSMGKEYWFLHFCAPPKDEQVVLTLGRSSEPVRVNKSKVRPNTKEGTVQCAAVCWHYGKNGKSADFNSIANVRIGKCGGKGASGLCMEHGKGKLLVSGKRAGFRIRLERQGKVVFSAKAKPQEKGVSRELVRLLDNPIAPRLGAAMINYYYDFSGKLEGKPLSGRAYLQKVVAVLPLAPWNWVRLHFAGGATLDSFEAKPLGGKAGLSFATKSYFEKGGRRIELGSLKIESWLKGEKRVWVLSGKNILAVMESYALQPFVMSQATTFRYDEYLVRVREFALKAKGRAYTLENLGQGVGLVEDASGYLL